MDHMARAGSSKHLALRHLVVQPTRLLVDIDQPVILTGDDDEGHLEAFVFSIEGICGGYHERRLCGVANCRLISFFCEARPQHQNRTAATRAEYRFHATENPADALVSC